MTCKVAKVAMIKFTVWGRNSAEVKHKGRWSLKAVPERGEVMELSDRHLHICLDRVKLCRSSNSLKYTSKTCLFVCGNFP